MTSPRDARHPGAVAEKQKGAPDAVAHRGACVACESEAVFVRRQRRRGVEARGASHRLRLFFTVFHFDGGVETSGLAERRLRARRDELDRAVDFFNSRERNVLLPGRVQRHRAQNRDRRGSRLGRGVFRRRRLSSERVVDSVPTPRGPVASELRRSVERARRSIGRAFAVGGSCRRAAFARSASGGRAKTSRRGRRRRRST